MPSGHDSEAARAIYEHFYAEYLRNAGGDATLVQWSQVGAILAWGVILVGFFFAYAFLRERFSAEQPHGIINYGSIKEWAFTRLSWLNWLLIGGTVLWAAWVVVSHAVNGQIY